MAVLQITGPGRGTVGCSLRFAAVRPNTNRQGQLKGSSETFATHVSDVRATADVEHLTFTNRFTQAYPGSIQSLDGAARIVAPGGKITNEGDAMVISGTDCVLAMVRLEPVYEAGQSHLGAIKQALDEIEPDYDGLLKRHAAIHGECSIAWPGHRRRRGPPASQRAAAGDFQQRKSLPRP